PQSRPAPAANHPRMIVAVDALQKIAPEDAEAMLRVSRVVFEYGEPRGSIALHRDLLDRIGDDLGVSERAAVLYRLGESARRGDDHDTALAALEDAAELDPASALALQ